MLNIFKSSPTSVLICNSGIFLLCSLLFSVSCVPLPLLSVPDSYDLESNKTNQIEVVATNNVTGSPLESTSQNLNNRYDSVQGNKKFLDKL
jgi:hypothetical protein